MLLKFKGSWAYPRAYIFFCIGVVMNGLINFPSAERQQHSPTPGLIFPTQPCWWLCARSCEHLCPPHLSLLEVSSFVFHRSNQWLFPLVWLMCSWWTACVKCVARVNFWVNATLWTSWWCPIPCPPPPSRLFFFYFFFFLVYHLESLRYTVCAFLALWINRWQLSI